MSPRSILVALRLAFVFVAACGASRPQAHVATRGASRPSSMLRASKPPVVAAVEPRRPPEPAHVRVLHASADPHARMLSVFVDGSAGALLRSVDFESQISYADVPSNTRTLTFRRDRSEATLLDVAVQGMEPGHFYTAILYGSAVGSPMLAANVHEDVPVASREYRNTLRFFNAMVGAPALDVCRVRNPDDDRQPILINAAFGHWGIRQVGLGADSVAAMPEAVEVVSNGRVTFEIRAAGRGTCAGSVLGAVHFVASSRLNGTMIAVGRFHGRGVAPQMFMCADAPSDTNCITASLDGRRG
jgi:hypothetical protein